MKSWNYFDDLYRIQRMAKSTRISSLPLQVALYFNGWYLVLFYITEMALLIYKGAE